MLLLEVAHGRKQQNVKSYNALFKFEKNDALV